MNKMDLYSDPAHAHLRHMFATFPKVAEFVGEAQFEDARELIPKTAFAWDSESRFPVHTPEHAAISRLYASQGPVPTDVLQTIKEACAIFDVPEEIFEQGEIKEASLADDECLFPATGTYPVRSSEEVKLAEKRLLPQLAKMSAETRKEAFSKLASAADLHGVKLADRSYQLAGRTYTDSRVLAASLEGRASATKVAALKENYLTLASAVKRNSRELRSADMRSKLAATIATLDKEAGLQRYYERGLADPMTTVFNTTKVASANALDLGGVQADPSSLAALGPKFFADTLGDDILRDIVSNGQVDATRLGEVLVTLPADLKRTIGQAAKDAGVAC